MGTSPLVGSAAYAPLARGRGAVIEGYTGHPDGLLNATPALLEQADGPGLEWDVTSSADGGRWGRGWNYKTDGPGMSKWETELAFRFSGQLNGTTGAARQDGPIVPSQRLAGDNWRRNSHELSAWKISYSAH
jgi:hypothetical protein